MKTWRNIKKSAGHYLEFVTCSNNCGEKLERQYLLDHVRIECVCRNVYFQYCYEIEQCQFNEGQHQDGSPKSPLSCHNKCEIEAVPREDMEAHRQECPLEMICCE